MNALQTHYPVALPPSAWTGIKPAGWYADVEAACYYCQGRQDAGEKRDTNRDYTFAQRWADAKWEFKQEHRHYLPALHEALRLFDAGEVL